MCGRGLSGRDDTVVCRNWAQVGLPHQLQYEYTSFLAALNFLLLEKHLHKLTVASCVGNFKEKKK